MRNIKIRVAVMMMTALVSCSAFAAAPSITSASSWPYGSADYMRLIFYGSTTGPFIIQTSTNLLTSWTDITDASINQLRSGVYEAVIAGLVNAPNRFYRVVDENDPATELKGWWVTSRLNTPANGSCFVTGEAPTATVSLLNTKMQAFTTNDMSSFRLYMYGPQDVTKSVTPCGLLGTSSNRAASVHHYINLLTNNVNATVSGNVITFPLRPVTTEPAGTYTLGVVAKLLTDSTQQVAFLTDIQIGTATVETQVVAKAAGDGTPRCSSCHLGPASGKVYLHHIDSGSWSYDMDPVKTCKLCHNNEGYASVTYTNTTGFLGTAYTNSTKVPDAIVRRVHGLHMGEGLKYYNNTNSVTGDFRDYTPVVFPADVRNCTKCHLNDNWKTKPSRLACGTCHDDIWFGSTPSLPTNMVQHTAGFQSDDSLCIACHKEGSFFTAADIVLAHTIPTPMTNGVIITMDPPANGLYYAAVDAPKVYIKFGCDSGTNMLGYDTLLTTGKFSTANLYVYGPRSQSAPVLTYTATNGPDTKRASITCIYSNSWNLSNLTFKIAFNGTDPTNILFVTTNLLMTATDVVSYLNVNAGITNTTLFNGGAIAGVSGKAGALTVNIKSLIRGTNSMIKVYNSAVTTVMGWKALTTVMEPDITMAAVSSAANDLRPNLSADPLDFQADPNVTRTTSNIVYQLPSMAGLASGTYNIFSYYIPKSAASVPGITNKTGFGHINFQVGATNVQNRIASCDSCHGDEIFHLWGDASKTNYSSNIHAEPFDVDYCNACHDADHPKYPSTGEYYKNQGGTSVNGWSGFGTTPISRRVHGVHFGNYLTYPTEVYGNATTNTFGLVIFPVDVRNCTICHTQNDTWKQQPSRLVCMACHDSDAAKIHGKLMTYIPDTNDPYGASAVESCDVCHDANAAYAPDIVHRLTGPFVPPYPRALRAH